MIDVLIPNYNGASLLPTCLDSLRQQTRQDFCVTVVDDASTDESVALLRESYPETRVISMSDNSGLAKALNRAIAATQRPYVVLLNNDTEADPRWLEELIGTLEQHPEYAIAASKLRLFDQRDVLHSAGDGYHCNGVPYNRGVWERDQGQYDDSREVFGPCAGAAAYRRELLERLAINGRVFDEELFMYCEDVDLNLRARLAGERTVFVPGAIVYHMVSATGGGTLASYYVGRNSILIWLKNMPAPIIKRCWVAFLRSQLGIAGDALRHIRGAAARARLRGQLAAIPAVPRFLAKRRHVPQRVDSDQFMSLFGM